MSRDGDDKSELTASREEIAAMLSSVADGFLAGSIRLGDGADAVTIDTSEEISLEIEFETADDELSLELEWCGPFKRRTCHLPHQRLT